MGMGNVCKDEFLLLFIQDVRNPRTMAAGGLIISKKDRANQQLDSFISLQRDVFNCLMRGACDKCLCCN